MSDADWDADDFEPVDVTAKLGAPATDKWDGEDEDDDIKDSWDKSDSDSEKAGDENAVKAVQRKKKKKLADIIAEKEERRISDLEARAQEEAAKKAADTPEGRLAEKLRLQKIDEDTNLQLAKDMLGLGSSGNIDGMIPTSKDDFDKFEKALTEKITRYNTSEHYPDFIEALLKNLCLDLNAPTLKKIKMNIEALHSAKLKEERDKTSKKKKPGKVSLRNDTTKEVFGVGAGGYDDMDDFM